MSRPRPPRHQQIEASFRRLDHRLHAAVAAAAHTSEANIDDACAFAWQQLTTHSAVRLADERRLFAWLRTVAVHEAWRLHGRQLGDGLHRVEHLADPAGELYLLVHQRERVAGAFARLPERAQRYLVLQALGYTYREIAVLQGTTPRAVDRALTRARAALRDLDEPGGESHCAAP